MKKSGTPAELADVLEALLDRDRGLAGKLEQPDVQLLLELGDLLAQSRLATK